MLKKRVLVVDDEPDVVETIKFSLEQKGFEVLTAYDGYEALGVVRAEEPHLVVLDVIENGYRVSRFIKEDIKGDKLSKNIAVLLLTACRLDNDPERETTFMDFSQADLMMYKPFDMDELIKNIHGLLGQSIK
ncbi:MAG TPA: response regulator transcription factor [Syntrophaceae bacterium]|nr:response regulator transcription factor [Syntrophaceae bacterium]